jgi:uncharacterized protein YaeQ
MALRATIAKVKLQVSDLDRSHFGEYFLTLAQHPSETAERLMVRLLAFALHASESLQFGKGLSDQDEAALWDVDLDGTINCWIDVGLPDEARLKKACSRAKRVVLLTYGGKSADMWWKQNATSLANLENLSIYQISATDSASLARLVGKNMQFTWTIQEGMVYTDQADIQPLTLKTA